MGGNNIIKKGLVFAVIILFIGVAFASSINANISMIQNLSDTCQFKGNYWTNGDMGKDVRPLGFPPRLEWQKRFSEYSSGHCVKQTADGGYIIGGRAKDDALIVKTDSEGQEEWSRVFSDSSICRHVLPTPDGGYVLWLDVSDANIILRKINGVGDTIWEKVVNLSDDWGIPIHISVDGGFTFVGDCGEDYFCLIKIDANGSELWNKKLYVLPEGINNSQLKRHFTVEQTNDSGYIIFGSLFYYEGYSYNPCAFLLKTDSEGNQQWNQSFEEGWWESIVTCSGALTNDGGFVILVGSLCYPCRFPIPMLIKTDVNGNELWRNVLEDNVYRIYPTSDGGYILIGFNIFKIDKNFNQEWWIKYEWSRLTDEYDIQQTADDGYIITGRFSGLIFIKDHLWLAKLGVPSTVEKTTFMIGNVTNVITNTTDGVMFEAVNVRCLQFSPLYYINLYHNEQIKVSDKYFGILKDDFIFGLFKIVG